MVRLSKKSRYATEQPFVLIKLNEGSDNNNNVTKFTNMNEILELKKRGNEHYQSGMCDNASAI